MALAIDHQPASSETLTEWSTVHAALAALSAIGLSVAAAGSFSVPVLRQTLLLAAMTAVIGVPHGGLDHRFGRGVCHRWTGRWWPIVFAVGYLLIVTLVLVGWVIVPMATIGFFFVLSAIHFGDGESLPLAAVEGGMVIWVPFLARPEEAARLLAWVTPGQLSESIQRAAVELRPLAWALAAIMIGRIIVLAWAGVRGRSPRAAVEAFRLTAFAGLFATAPVLLSFVAFFCGWHSARELAQLAVRANPARPLRGLATVINHSAPLTVVVVVATILGARWRLSGGHTAEVVVVQAVFLSLSAIAIPHILLHAIAQRLDVDPFALEAK